MERESTGSDRGTINFTKLKYEKLKLDYQRALKNKKEIIYIDNTPTLVHYAKYLLEYLKPKFEKNEEYSKIDNS